MLAIACDVVCQKVVKVNCCLLSNAAVLIVKYKQSKSEHLPLALKDYLVLKKLKQTRPDGCSGVKTKF
jgi:hypothetical protein